MSEPPPLPRLVRLLRAAHAGERAAAYAYRGHARSVRSADERAAIERIEREEWAHRVGVHAMIVALGARPARLRELVFAAIGRILGALCHVTGWFLPMHGAGRIERRNIQEYLDAAALAERAGRHAFVAPLLRMAEVEREHEAYFRARVERHWLRRIVPMWPAPPPIVAPAASADLAIGGGDRAAGAA